MPLDGTIVPILSDRDIVTARQAGRALALTIGLSAGDAALVATAISELARNIVAYAFRGEIRLDIVHHADRAGIVVMAVDAGPGIPNVEQALRDGYSTSGGLGLGLPGVRRLMDQFEIRTSGDAGTTVRVTKWQS